jgi:hypothetical protein
MASYLNARAAGALGDDHGTPDDWTESDEFDRIIRDAYKRLGQQAALEIIVGAVNRSPLLEAIAGHLERYAGRLAEPTDALEFRTAAGYCRRAAAMVEE